jgi:hypothetical protein
MQRGLSRLCDRVSLGNVPAMSACTPLQLGPEDKLDLLRYLDEFHYWHSVDDQRVCKRCGHKITGRQVFVIELQGTRGKLRLKCPTAGCVATPGDWSCAKPVQAARRLAVSPARAEKAKAEAIAQQRTHRGDLAAKRKLAAATKRASIFAPAPLFRAALARLVLVRPIAAALHTFRPIT